MIIIPAIDIKNGECVRLVQGSFETAHKVAQDALETAKQFEKSGAEYLHMVDLDGAKDGKPVNHELITKVAKAISIPVEVGGGIRTAETVDFYIENGVSRVILGSAALQNPDMVKEAIVKYGKKISVGIDAKNGFVSTEGWLQTSSVNYIEFAKMMAEIGVSNIIFTDISRDGTLNGPNLNALLELAKSVPCDITASGGIKDINDISALKKLGLYGAICGKSIYSGTLDLKEAIRLSKED
ncbi:MAG: 1-(5-phosphoribosyl)-5-[(5-phosphoribosylamino)methylideneamino]imidazole-4-carboxamide isomerase [Bacillota bacterium]|nr:1-(5-phosphoribosyl)-5-[(5-phosphoribosylamino)methylideneamino]imidazole-4-carboxamide isomerase [Bacillota bacterium]